MEVLPDRKIDHRPFSNESTRSRAVIFAAGIGSSLMEIGTNSFRVLTKQCEIAELATFVEITEI